MTGKRAVKASFAVLLTGLMAAASLHALAISRDRHETGHKLALSEPASGDKVIPSMPMGQSRAGAFLASHFAQQQNDWKKATELLDTILAQDPDNHELLRQSMVLAAGSGQHALAAERARHLIAIDPNDSLASLILATDTLANGKYDDSLKVIAAMPKGDMTDFVVPLLEGWANAGKKIYKPEALKGTTIHAWHGALIALYLKRPPQDVFSFAETILAPSGLTAEEVERAADLMSVSGHQQDAINIYKALQSQKGGSDLLAKKIAMAEKGEDVKSVVPAFRVDSPATGAAMAIYDLARILYQEKSDVSARVFAEMALHLDPDLVSARILIASSYARSGQIDAALEQYKVIPEDNPDFIDVQHASAELLYENNRMDEAVTLLTALYEKYKNPDSMIRIGDLYRGKENYKKAIEIYNRVADSLPKPLPEEFWHLLYSRGMAYERLGEWSKAEQDLQAALKYQPDHPYIMNYLAYGWADQGVHLEESLAMLKKAAALRPNDGFITDSLGWVHYMAGYYDEAVPHLEQAVQLMPYDTTINEHLGDAYWRVNRKVEARFQWERARNYSKDPAQIAKMNEKLANGLDPAKATQQAKGPVDSESVNR